MSRDLQHPLIAVDVGNSRIKVGLFNGRVEAADCDALPACLESTAVDVEDFVPWDEVRHWAGMRSGTATSGIVAGANPKGVSRVAKSWPAEFMSRPRIIDSPAGFPLQTAVGAPEKVGIDRLLNAIAANRIRPENGPAVIVDTGTATTVDVVSSDGAFLGGAILPGLELSAVSLHRYTALLPLISVDELAQQPHPPLGSNTREALRSGIFWGQLGAIKELLDRLGTETSGDAFVVLTGGGAALLAPHLSNAHWEPHLSLQGLVLAAGV